MAKAPEVPEQYKQIIGVFHYTLKGRLMWLRPPNAAALTLLRKYHLRLSAMDSEAEGMAEAAMDVTAKTLNVIDGQFLDKTDRDWVEDKILASELDLPDLLPILAGGRKQAVPDDDAEIEVGTKGKPARRVSIPAKPDAAKKAPAKKVANAKRSRA